MLSWATYTIGPILEISSSSSRSKISPHLLRGLSILLYIYPLPPTLACPPPSTPPPASLFPLFFSLFPSSFFSSYSAISYCFLAIPYQPVSSLYSLTLHSSNCFTPSFPSPLRHPLLLSPPLLLLFLSFFLFLNSSWSLIRPLLPLHTSPAVLSPFSEYEC